MLLEIVKTPVCDSSRILVSYSSGVYSNSRCSSTALTHAMVVTGYGTYNGNDYYLVKNR